MYFDVHIFFSCLFNIVMLEMPLFFYNYLLNQLSEKKIKLTKKYYLSQYQNKYFFMWKSLQKEIKRK